MGYSVGKEDLKVIPLLKSLAAELLGTMLLVIFGCGTAMQLGQNDLEKDFGYTTKVSLAFGLAVMAIACFTGHVSGGEFSLVSPSQGSSPLLREPQPSRVRGSPGRRRALPHQVLPLHPGSVLGSNRRQVGPESFYLVMLVSGAGILYGATKKEERDSLGSNAIGSASTTAFGGMMMELIGSMVLVLVVYATAVDKKNKSSPMVPPLLIGLTVTVCHLLLIPYTGTSINPARSLGPALVSNTWGDHWVFWVGPLLGGAIGGVLYKFVLKNNNDDD